ncbi:hypothetical protein BgiBS90_022713 [Biomphalaria glabrata]|nr:hypothetical protein BgiMline_026091 [Biomphalaria glabrata]KAI8776965.1 hypothetical protein BgiBS90_022713 [Biomphalaria glabrata]
MKKDGTSSANRFSGGSVWAASSNGCAPSPLAPSIRFFCWRCEPASRPTGAGVPSETTEAMDRVITQGGVRLGLMGVAFK